MHCGTIASVKGGTVSSVKGKKVYTITNIFLPGGNIMGKVTIELNNIDHKKLKMICTDKDIKIKDYVLEILQKRINEDIKNLDIFQE